MNPSNRALVVFSGGQDSTTCLLLARQEFGPANVEALSFAYGQRHAIELERARFICEQLQVPQTLLRLDSLGQITHNALMDAGAEIQRQGALPNTFVAGRNALFLLYAAIFASERNLGTIYLGVSQTDYSGYPDCRDVFVKSMNVSLNLALGRDFDVRTPLMYRTKKETWALADELGGLELVRDHSHSCYRGVAGGCHDCPSCRLREESLRDYLAERAGV